MREGGREVRRREDREREGRKEEGRKDRGGKKLILNSNPFSTLTKLLLILANHRFIVFLQV